MTILNAQGQPVSHPKPSVMIQQHELAFRQRMKNENPLDTTIPFRSMLSAIVYYLDGQDDALRALGAEMSGAVAKLDQTMGRLIAENKDLHARVKVLEARPVEACRSCGKKPCSCTLGSLTIEALNEESRQVRACDAPSPPDDFDD